MDNQMVVFDLANEHYGLDIASVDSIIAMQDITSVPQAPDFVEGITNLRGTVLPVVDLRKRFGLPKADYTKDTRIVVVAIENLKVGMIVDGVTEVLHVSDECMEPPSPLVTTAASAFITSIAKVDKRMIILVDLAKVLTVEEKGDLAGSLVSVSK